MNWFLNVYGKERSFNDHLLFPGFPRRPDKP